MTIGILLEWKRSLMIPSQIDAISENEKIESSKPDASPKPKDKKSKVLTHLRNSIDPGEISQRIFTGQILLSIGEVNGLSTDIQKVLSQTMSPEKLFDFPSNLLVSMMTHRICLLLRLILNQRIGVRWDIRGLL